MTRLDELTQKAFEASQAAWREHGPGSVEIERAAVLAVLAEVLGMVPEERPVTAVDRAQRAMDMGWNNCRAEMLRRLDAAMEGGDEGV